MILLTRNSISVSRTYAGFPSVAAYGNSLVTLYTGKLKLSRSLDPELCVSTTIDDETDEIAVLKLSSCSNE